MKNIIIVFLLLPVICFSQSKFSVGLNVGAKAGILSSTGEKNRSISQKANIKFGYSIALDATYQIADHIFIRSGFGFEKSNFGHQTEGVLWGTCIEAALAVGETPKETNYYDDFSIKSIIVPVDLGYVFRAKEGTEKFYLGIGVQYNRVLDVSTNQRVEKEGFDTEQFENFEGIIDTSPFSGKLFFGFEFPFSKLKIGIEPIIKFTPNEVDLIFLSESSILLEPGLNIRLSL